MERYNVLGRIGEGAHGVVLKAKDAEGENDIEQLWFVIRTLGTLKECDWPEIKEFPDYNKITFTFCEPTLFEDILPDAPEVAVDFVKTFLIYQPKSRISAKNALLHEYFTTEPLPAHYSEMQQPNHTRSQTLQSRPTYESVFSQSIELLVADCKSLKLASIL